MPTPRRRSVGSLHLRRHASGLIGAALALWPATVLAQVPLSAIGDLFAERPERRLASQGAIFDASGPLGQATDARRRARWVSVGDRLGVLRLADGDLPAALLARPRATWSPPRHLLLDRARAGVRAPTLSLGTTGSGQGVVIGIVDAGVDVSHPDLRNEDGTTRVAWWIDFSSNPAGRQPALESALGCEPEAGLRCRILSAADIDELLQNAVDGDEPRDLIGHGTHIASIAAGNGRAGGGASFAGMAPRVTLIAAKVTGAVGTIADGDVVLATEFVFERAAELGMPAVVNLSLGGDFGAHDGSSELSQVLAGFVGADAPGRAIVVAGGNSGEVLSGLTDQFPEPLGIHTEVAVTLEKATRVPLLTPYPTHGRGVTDASLFIWLNLYPAEGLTVALVLPDGTRSNPIGLGQVETMRSDAAVAALIHGMGDGNPRDALAEDLPDVMLDDLPAVGAAVMLVDGEWASGGTFTIEIAGAGRAELWVQSEGDLAPETGSVGALFSAATPQQTVTIPATHPALIAVGASVNRLDWTDHTGAYVDVSAFPGEPTLAVGGAAFFSSAGTNALGDVKPDLLAPGGFVIAAMAALADPRRGGGGVFWGGLCPGFGCQVISDGYAVTAGTSMAAPMVSGAVALLFERDPTLTQGAVRRLLQSASTPIAPEPEVAGREGGGVLNIAGSIEALTSPLRGLAERPDPGQSRLRTAGAFAVPDSTRSLATLIWLRDADGVVFDAAPERLRVEVVGAEVSQLLRRVGPGLYEVWISAAPGSESVQIEAFVDDESFLTRQIPIDVPRRVDDSSRDEGCSASGGATPSVGRSDSARFGLLALALAAGWRRRWRSRAFLRSRPDIS